MRACWGSGGAAPLERLEAEKALEPSPKEPAESMRESAAAEPGAALEKNSASARPDHE